MNSPLSNSVQRKQLLSKPLHTLIKGHLSEAQAGCTLWKEVSKETFERFVQFAYTGDYSVPDTRDWTTVAEPQKHDTNVSKAFESKPAKSPRRTRKRARAL